MRWVALVLALGVGTVASCRQPSMPSIFVVPVPRFTLPADVPGWFAFCVEHPAMNWERPGEPKVAGWTTPEMTKILVPLARKVICRKCGETVRIWHVVEPDESFYECECGCRWPIQQPESD